MRDIRVVPDIGFCDRDCAELSEVVHDDPISQTRAQEAEYRDEIIADCKSKPGCDAARYTAHGKGILDALEKQDASS